MLKGKTIVLGVTGGIACYKAAALASQLVKLHADVQVVMTENATKFITPLTFEQLTGHRVPVDTFDRGFEHSVADMFYMAAAGQFTLRALVFILLVIAGNSVGALVFDRLLAGAGVKK